MIETDSSDDWLLQHQMQQEAEEEEEQKNAAIAAAFEQLAELGVDKVRITHESVGDELAVTRIVATAEGHEVELSPELRESLSQARWASAPQGWQLVSGVTTSLALDIYTRDAGCKRGSRAAAHHPEEAGVQR